MLKFLNQISPFNSKTLLLAFVCVGGVFVLFADQSDALKKKNEINQGRVKVMKTEEEWKAQLTTEEFRILRKAGTERPHGKIYQEFKEHGAGVYFCAGCDTELFSSKEKFESHCGWPSFLTLPRWIMSKPQWIIFWVTLEPRCCVQFVMGISDMFSRARGLIHLQIRDIASMVRC